ncbi:MAG: hypothetical protein Cons2KO_07350 [Congregibacter sp.]
MQNWYPQSSLLNAAVWPSDIDAQAKMERVARFLNLEYVFSYVGTLALFDVGYKRGQAAGQEPQRPQSGAPGTEFQQ